MQKRNNGRSSPPRQRQRRSGEGSRKPTAFEEWLAVQTDRSDVVGELARKVAVAGIDVLALESDSDVYAFGQALQHFRASEAPGTRLRALPGTGSGEDAIREMRKLRLDFAIAQCDRTIARLDSAIALGERRYRKAPNARLGAAIQRAKAAR